MKFFGSLLILAGVFALINASESEEDQVVKDKLMLEDLKRSLAYRTVDTVKCSEDLLNDMEIELGIYNDGMTECGDTLEKTKQIITENTTKVINSFSARLQATCDKLNKCVNGASPFDNLGCLVDESSEGADDTSSVSSDAETEQLEYKRNMDNASGVASLCKNKCMSSYTEKSNKLQGNFQKCIASVESGESNPPAPVPTPGQEPTEEPEQPQRPEQPEQPEQPEEPSGGEEENPSQRKIRANKYQRF